ASALAAAGRRRLGGWSTRRPCSSARRLTGGAVSTWLRPVGLSGCVTAATTSTGESGASSRRSTVAAKAGVPKKTARGRSRTRYPLPLQGGLRLALLLLRLDPVDLRAIPHAVEEERSLQVIDLVLEDARQPPFRLDPHLLTFAVAALDRQAGGTGDRPLPVGRGKAALLIGRLAAALDDLRIDQRVELVLVLDDDHP